MPPKAKATKPAPAKANGAAKANGKAAPSSKAAKDAEKRAASPALSDRSDESAETLASSVSNLSLGGSTTAPDPEAGNRTSSGVLTSHRQSRDIKIELYSLSFYSNILLQETTIELNFGRRYGLIGANGCGKSTFLRSLAAREAPIPDHIDIYLLKEEYAATEQTALEAVVAIGAEEVKRLEDLMEQILTEDPESELLDGIYESIDRLDPNTFEARASMILHGLGFDAKRMKKMTKDLSGGWRMRVSLARALFVRPTLLIMDEPTNHLDLGACVWLEEYLKRYDRILLIVSHSQDFLNNVCTNIIDWTPKKTLQYYTGNYDQYVQTFDELSVNQNKQFDKQQAEIKHMKEFIASVGTYANLVRQAKSRQKILDKMEADGLVEKVEKRKTTAFYFQEIGKLPPPLVAFTQVSFSYNGSQKREDLIYKDLDLGVDMDSRVALVGPNGAGKSTLLKLMTGELVPVNGTVSRHTNMKMVRYHQHAADQLDMTASAIEYLRSKFPDLPRELQFWRQQIGRFGLTGNSQLCPIRNLSDGQRARIVFCEIALSRPHIILFDEPTNALDIDSIDALADAINEFTGGVVLVSHDFRLISQVAEDILVCENGTVTKWEGTIAQYKDKLRDEVQVDLKGL
ncbi:P-loop containing nucleoside triphosphate hydrolase protein [Hyaloraphidium curvatum]|nr:P-loop containing nucleoside triphosphate hydrolase protein [Hyaloraphidium curvatum]KAI9021353.1 P-loop containing nucleoside triphosphate hydrolase protein [Hyaloraphidium curvatum]